jgi:SPFH domain / Band 7 family
MMTYLLFGLALFVLVVLFQAVKIVPQKQVKLIERLGKYHRTADAGLNTIFPFLDSVRDTIDLREQITKIEPQPVITRDNVTMEVDAVIYYVIVDPVRATYEVQNLKWGIEQLTLSALRNVIGALDLDHTLTFRDTINAQAALGARQRNPAMGHQGDAHRAEEHHTARGNPPDDGKADDGGADAAGGGHDGGRRKIFGHPARGRSETVADRQR